MEFLDQIKAQQIPFERDCPILSSHWQNMRVVVEKLPVSVGEARDMGSIPGLGRSHGQRSLMGYSLWGHIELDTTK